MSPEATLGYPPPTTGVSALRVSARYLGKRIDVRALSDMDIVARAPAVIRIRESGWMVLFRYGAVVFIGLDHSEEASLLTRLRPHVLDPSEDVQVEELTAAVDPKQEELVDGNGLLRLRGTDPGRIQVVAEVMAKSTALAHYESEVGRVFNQLEPVVEKMCRGKRVATGQGRLLRQLGEVLMTQARVIGRVEVAEKPEFTWDDPALDRLFERLATEFELVPRNALLTKKTEFISGCVGVLIDLSQQKQSIRVEWYIVILIVVEIVILVFDLSTR